jgi:hypothetical protein
MGHKNLLWKEYNYVKPTLIHIAFMEIIFEINTNMYSSLVLIITILVLSNK